jgi:hypothetical protein
LHHLFPPIIFISGRPHWPVAAIHSSRPGHVGHIPPANILEGKHTAYIALALEFAITDHGPEVGTLPAFGFITVKAFHGHLQYFETKSPPVLLCSEIRQKGYSYPAFRIKSRKKTKK